MVVFKAFEQNLSQSFKFTSRKKFSLQIKSKISKSSFSTGKLLLTAVLLAKSLEAVQFHCNFELRTTSTVNGTRYACIARVIETGSASLESVTGAHLAERSNDDVEWLLIDQQYLTSFPEGIAFFFLKIWTFC